jgi:hypothetical protein
LQVLEKTIEGRVVSWARKRGIKVKKKFAGDLLDRYFFLPHGRLFIIEFKRPGGKLSPRQGRVIKELEELGYDVEVHDNAEEAIEAIQRRLEAS